MDVVPGGTWYEPMRAPHLSSIVDSGDVVCVSATCHSPSCDALEPLEKSSCNVRCHREASFAFERLFQLLSIVDRPQGGCQYGGCVCYAILAVQRARTSKLLSNNLAAFALATPLLVSPGAAFAVSPPCPPSPSCATTNDPCRSDCAVPRRLCHFQAATNCAAQFHRPAMHDLGDAGVRSRHRQVDLLAIYDAKATRASSPPSTICHSTVPSFSLLHIVNKSPCPH